MAEVFAGGWASSVALRCADICITSRTGGTVLHTGQWASRSDVHLLAPGTGLQIVPPEEFVVPEQIK